MTTQRHQQPLFPKLTLISSLLLFLLNMSSVQAQATSEFELPEFPPSKQHFDPCTPESSFNYPAQGETTLCDQFPFYMASAGCTIAGGTTTTYGPSVLIENKNYVVNGIWTINAGASLIFRNCNFKMAPASGIILRVSPFVGSNPVTTVEDCNFFSCDTLWNGIKYEQTFVLPGGFASTFNFTDNHLEDAVIGVRFRNISPPAMVNISGNLFNNNYMGLSTYNNSSFFVSALQCTANNFGTTQNLRPPYSPLTLDGWPLAYTGILITECTAHIGQPTTTNSFYRMNHGIVCEGAILDSKHNTFSTLWENGIDAQGCNLTVSNGNTFTGLPTLPSSAAAPLMKQGIFARRSELYVEENLFEQRLQHGILSEENLYSERIEIHDNHFEQTTSSAAFGVEIERAAASASTLFPAHNRIYNNHCNAQLADNLSNYTCFNVKGTNVATDNMSIFDNQDINLTLNPSSLSGNGIAISGGNGDNYRVVNNAIQLGGAVFSANFFGINFRGFGSNNNHIDLNEITGTTTTTGVEPYTINCAIHLQPDNSEVNMCENTTHRSRYGVHFYAKSKFPTISENLLYNHVIGMRIENFVEVGNHNGSGNQWLGSYNEWAAQKLGSLVPATPGSTPINVRFWVPESNTLPFLPTGTLLSPNPDTESDPLKKWFRYKPDEPEEYCTTVSPISGLSYEESSIAEGITEIRGADLWDAQRNLYRKLLENPALAPVGSAAASFLTSYEYSSVGYFARFDADFRAATRFSAASQAFYDSLIQVVEQTNATIDSLYATVGYDLITASGPVKTQLQTLEELNVVNLDGLVTAKVTHRLLVQDALEDALALNDAITPANAQEAARQTMNSMYANLALGNALTESQYNNLIDIAEEGEATVGYVWNEAVSLLSPCKQGDYVVDEHEEERNKKQSDNPLTANNLYQVSPNPGADWFLITVPKATTGMLRITDITGTALRNVAIAPDQNSYTVDLGALPSGIYGITFFDADGRWLHTRKVIVQH